MKSKLEIAEAMYRKARSSTPAKMPETLEELAPHTQKRYLLLAEGVVELLAEEEDDE